MIGKELHRYKHYYGLLIIIEAILCSAFLVFRSHAIQVSIALCIGILYFFWGILTHRNEIKTVRLVLEYAFVGLLGTVLLVAIVASV